MADLDLDPSVVESYIERFYGHGSYEARYWFIGMEFGGGGTLDEVVNRLQGWYRRGGKELEDLGPEGVGAGSRWFRPPYALQPTWAKLIRIALTADGQPSDRESVRRYQRDQLGRQGGLDCILELLPLPSPGLGHWKFYPELANKYPQLAYLRNRETYTNHVAPMRIAHLKARIEEHRPWAVVFYGSGYRHWWQQIARVEFNLAPFERALLAHSDGTLFIVMQHPTARGISTDYFDAIGRFIAETPRP
ncbi:MAG: hypothetical protein M3328_16350 [Chloroflexota bacterium]|nr:hypothetical protein [Chloroflexota bacterium]